MGILWVYLKLMLASAPLFLAMFCYTWWIRGRGFREFAALFGPLLAPVRWLRSRRPGRRVDAARRP